MRAMKRTMYSDKQITYVWRQARSGHPSGGYVCCQLGVSEETYYIWLKQFAQFPRQPDTYGVCYPTSDQPDFRNGRTLASNCL